MAGKDYTIKIDIDDKFPADKALRKFKRYCEAFGVIKEYRKRKEYKKPSLLNKEKLEAAEKRRAKANRMKRRGSKI
ncbi:30S ribosomal protein S21 [Bacteriovorax sp. DB6_IX]|uniref:30S ribosomal protein S21 n=1 Tax=Bacteriovorax sp. DB6_IX TaxID=1353530 RepID=UPI00038A0BA2|nr:30S ribosomal protein S21 [Bacteriovorax sp. DB6_IX]EQC51359.1 ribosomal protein S21 [Bacteriovorax sp. DB6_IX]